MDHTILRPVAANPNHTKTLPSEWLGPDSNVARHIADQTNRSLEAYRAQPLLVAEHANIERATAQGGYGRRQIYELVQNGADALLGTPVGRIQVLLTDEALYCANEGEPIDIGGVDAILSSHVSLKRGTEIGRFGLGFKSVLGVSSRPQFFSRSGSFAFDSRIAAERIGAIVPDAERFPTLRVAWSLDIRQEADKDPVLAELCSWATTVVKLPLDQSGSQWLPEDLQEFPAEFLLFSPHVSSIVLQDCTSGTVRKITLTQNGDHQVELTENDRSSSWKIFEVRHELSACARADAGELADRPILPIIWAVPHTSRSNRGQVWAFFPTHYKTTLSGIVNAPWKTNEDRQNLLAGDFNEELLDVVAQLVVDSLGQLTDPEDPGRYLDLLPARGREAPNWADELLTEWVYKIAADADSLPDQNGILRPPRSLSLHPAGLPGEALEAWSRAPQRPEDWCHQSTDSRERRSRVERLLTLAERRVATIAEWLEALAAPRSAEASAAALAVAGILLRTVPDALDAVRGASIVLSTERKLVRPESGRVFTPVGDIADHSGVTLVHPLVVASPDASETLRLLDIRPIDVSSKLEAILARGLGHLVTNAQWEALWSLVRTVPLENTVRLIRTFCGAKVRRELRVRTIAGNFRPLHVTLLPGIVVPADGSRDQDVAIDGSFHREELDLLVELGATSEPSAGHGGIDEDWFDPYRYEARAAYWGDRGNRSLRIGLLDFEQAVTTGPLDSLSKLSDEGRETFTRLLLDAGREDPRWTLRHTSATERYPPRTFEPPSIWMAKREGRMRSSVGLLPVPQCVGPELASLAAVLPVVRCAPMIARAVDLPETTAELTDLQWDAAFATVNMVDDDATIGRFYAAAAEHLPAPAVVRCRLGTEITTGPPSQVTVVCDNDQAAAASVLHVRFVHAPSRGDAELLIDKWGMQSPAKSLAVEILPAPSGPAIPVVDAFPGFYDWLAPDNLGLQLMPCSSIREERLAQTGKTGHERDFARVEGLIYYVDHLQTDQLLDHLAQHIGAHLSEEDRTALLSQREDVALRERLSAIRAAPNLASRLLAAVGEDAISRRLPSGLLAAANGHPSGFDGGTMAAMALAVYGVETLRIFRSDLERQGLRPPQVWAGSYKAQELVRRLGFPQEFAGFGQSRPDPYLDVEGPPDLPPLHAFQERITEQIRLLLQSDDERRGLLSLPTGAGKTRVAVEALVEAIRDDDLPGPILWIAQTDELCEQAVQTWRFVWRALGARGRLRISRLWSTNEAAPAEGEGAHVVVATIQKLRGCATDTDYTWLSSAGCVVVDEAHVSTERSYTAILTWLGLGRGKDRCPLIGLTATPFRSNEDETRRLVGRFGGHRLDAGALGADPYVELQEMGVLARVDHELLVGAQMELDPAELYQLRLLHTLPASAEERLGADVNRNRALLDSIKRLPKDWPVLLFATSVDHAQTMAALLVLDGISAAAVTGQTEPGARRHHIEEFRRGRIRVLTNYAVLTAGFDAPSVRALYVARPIYTPVLYQQMIGRGLRGPLNGGKERCLIVNVQDNISQFGEDLAFRRFEYLWSRPS